MNTTHSNPGTGDARPDQPSTRDPGGHSLAWHLRHWIHELGTTLLPALILALLLTHFVAQGTVVYGQSMEPNLHTDQRLIIDKVSTHFRLPERGEIVVIDVDHSEIPLIKRIIGLPGETIQIMNGQVLIDGVVLEEPYLPQVPLQNFAPVRIPPGHVFVMGDNRGLSNDSRAFGPVSLDRIIGRAWFSYWPPEDFGEVR